MSRFNSTPRCLAFVVIACGLLAPAAAQERMVIHSDDAKS